MRLEASSILAKAHQGIDAVAERKAEAAARLKSLGQLIDPYLLVRATGDASWRKMRPKSASSATRYLNKSWAPLHGVPIEQITRQQLKARRNEMVTSFESTVAKRQRRIDGWGPRLVGK